MDIGKTVSVVQAEPLNFDEEDMINELPLVLDFDPEDYDVAFTETTEKELAWQ